MNAFSHAQQVAVNKFRPLHWQRLAPAAATVAAFVFLYVGPIGSLVRDWWSDPEAAHGLLLAPLAIFFLWRSGISRPAQPKPTLGLVVIGTAVVIRYVADLAAEFFTLRMSILLALAGLIIFFFGLRQLLRWWLPGVLLVLSVPLPQLVISTIAFPLQLRASALGATLLEWRDVPVQLAGNIIHIPGQSLFVTEACSGLRSLSALISLGVVMGAIWLSKPTSRLLILLLTVPIAMALNGVRIFLTGYLVHFGSPALGTGFMHWTEGWVLFVAAFGVIGALTALLVKAEQWRWVRSA